jgi:leucyl-tRNA synthetase
VTADFDNRWHFNTSIAALMELTNELYALEASLTTSTLAQAAEALVLMLGPFAPFAAQEMWDAMGRAGFVFRQSWPAANPDLAREDEVEVPVQVNGKLRSRVTVALGVGKDELERAALADQKIKALVDGKQIVKIVVVPDKLVNVVVKG